MKNNNLTTDSILTAIEAIVASHAEYCVSATAESRVEEMENISEATQALTFYVLGAHTPAENRGEAASLAITFGVDSGWLESLVREVLTEVRKPSSAPKARALSEVQLAMREYNAGKVSFAEYTPIARPNVDGLTVPSCPKCSGPMHPFFAKDGREFWGCKSRDCRGIVLPLSEEEAEARAYEAYTSK